MLNYDPKVTIRSMLKIYFQFPIFRPLSLAKETLGQTFCQFISGKQQMLL